MPTEHWMAAEVAARWLNNDEFVPQAEGEWAETVTAVFASTARGIRDVAREQLLDRYGHPYAQFHRAAGSSALVKVARLSANARGVVLFTRSFPKQTAGVPLLPGEHEFGPDGLLGLKAINLVVDPGRPENAQLCLALRHPDAALDGAFVTACFALDGGLTARQFVPAFYDEGPLRVMLATLPAEHAWQMNVTDPDDVYTLPAEITATLIPALPLLGAYLSEVVNLLKLHS